MALREAGAPREPTDAVAGPAAESPATTDAADATGVRGGAPTSSEDPDELAFDEDPAVEPGGDEEAGGGSDDTALVFRAIADATVSEAAPDTPAGWDVRARSDRTPEQWAYVMFRVTGLDEALAGPGAYIKDVRLELFATDPSDFRPVLYRAPSTWSEGTLTWNRRPKFYGGAYLAAPSADWDDPLHLPILDQSWVVLRPGHIFHQGPFDGRYTLALITASGDGIQFVTRESGRRNRRPRLVVVIGTRLPAQP